MKKVLALLVMAFALMGQSAMAATTPEQAAKELLLALKVDVLMNNQLMGFAKQSEESLLAGRQFSEKEREIVKQSIRDTISTAWANEIEASQVRIYAKRFSVAELEELKKFFTSPTGKKLCDFSFQESKAGLAPGPDRANRIAKFFTAPEIEELKRFFATPTGAKYNSLSGQITKEGMDDATAWGFELGARMIKNIDTALVKAGFKKI